MFEKSNEIVKVYGNGKLLSAKLLHMRNGRKKSDSEPDFIDKVKIEVATFGANANAQGKKLQSQVDAFLDLEDVPVFANILRTYAMRAIETNFAIEQQIIREKPASVKIYSRYGGTTESGQVIARIFEIATGGPTMRADFMVTAEEAPGVKGDKGQIIKQQGAQSIKKVSLALKADTAMTVACALERAINIYDVWSANDSVEENFYRIMPKRSSAEALPVQPQDGYAAGGYDSGYQSPGGYDQGYMPQPQGYAVGGAGYNQGRGAGYNGFI